MSIVVCCCGGGGGYTTPRKGQLLHRRGGTLSHADLGHVLQQIGRMVDRFGIARHEHAGNELLLVERHAIFQT